MFYYFKANKKEKKKPYRHISLYLKCNMLYINTYRANKAAAFYARKMKEVIRELLFWCTEFLSIFRVLFKWVDIFSLITEILYEFI